MLFRSLGHQPGVCVTAVDLDDVAKYRGQIPILSGRRTDLYETIQKT